MNKLDMAKLLAEASGDITKKQATEFLDILFGNDGIVTTALVQGEDVRFSGFGLFSVKERRARMGRNPRTGAPVKVPTRRVVRFHPLSRLKMSVR